MNDMWILSPTYDIIQPEMQIKVQFYIQKECKLCVTIRCVSYFSICTPLYSRLIILFTLSHGTLMILFIILNIPHSITNNISNINNLKRKNSVPKTDF